MVQKNKLINYLFGIVTTLVVVFTISFGIYEYRREHAFRCDILHAQLQLNNMKTLSPSSSHDGVGVDTTFRVTIIDAKGNVVYDSREKDVKKMGNHLHRKEIQDALRCGSGYDIKRESETNGETYFYSATLMTDASNYSLPITVKGMGKESFFIRSAVPYSAPLTASLERDYTFLYYTIGILVLIAVVLYLRSRLNSSEAEKQRIKRQLTENAAHELKTPAATINGYLETLADNPSMPEEKRKEFIERCYIQSRRMSRLLSDMSTLTQLDEANLSRPAVEVDVAQILRQIADETSIQFEEKRIEVRMSSVPQHLPLQGDSSLIDSLFRNIFSNALSYAAGASYFEIKVKASKDEYVFQMIDNGVGVPAEHLPHLFERFYRTDKGRSRRLGGTGLGLAIVKNIAVRYGGYANATNTIGGGLTVEIGLSVK